LGASPRGSLAVIKVARGRAVLHGRDFVTPDDIRAIALPALAHRVVLSDESWARGARAQDVMRTVIDSVAAPTWK
jgi:MoxR-like ATPase